MERPSFINPDLSFDFISQGKRSEAYKAGDYAVKLLKKTMPEEKALETARSFQRQYEQLRSYLGPYVAESGFFVAGKDNMATVGIVQPKIEGVFLKDATREQLHSYHVLNFLEKSLQMYDETGLFPDIKGPGPLGWLQTQHTENVILTNGKNGPFPILVDAVFSWSIRKIPGPFLSKLLKHGTEKLWKDITSQDK